MRQSSALEDLAKRSYRSYLARLAAEKRLRSNGRWWNAAQFSLSTSLVSVSVVLLGFPNSQTTLFGVALIILSILALVVSVVVTHLDYSGRSSRMFHTYRSLQAFSVRIETLVTSRAHVGRRRLRSLQHEYDQIMDSSENHETVDHQVALANFTLSAMSLGLLLRSASARVLPLALMLVSGAALALSIWVAVGVP